MERTFSTFIQPLIRTGANNLVFNGNLDSGANSPPFNLVAGADGTGTVSVAQAGEIGVTIFEVADNAVLVIKEQTEQ